MKKRNTNIIPLILSGVLFTLSACVSAVDSGELISTQASDLKIVGTVYEYKGEEEAQISAQMQTKNSETPINFTQGEILTVQSDGAEGSLSASVSLSEDDGLLNLDQMYEGYVSTTIEDGNYYLTYTDKDGVSTTATIPTFSVPAITSPTEGSTVNVADSVVVTWDAGSVEVGGTLYIQTTYSTSGSTGVHRESTANDGEATIDISSHRGSGSISLVHENSFNSFEGFAEAKIYMKNISRVNVSYSSETTAPPAMMMKASEELDAEALIQACQHECSENEEETITIEEVTYNCCTNQ